MHTKVSTIASDKFHHESSMLPLHEAEEQHMLLIPPANPHLPTSIQAISRNIPNKLLCIFRERVTAKLNTCRFRW